MITFEHVTKLYGKQKAVNDLSFDVPEGQVVGFLGPNGAGKSTSMKILTGYIPASTGLAKVNGMDVAQHPQEVKYCVGYLPEHNPLYLDMYVKEYLRYVAKTYKLKGKVNQHVADIVERVGLGKEQHKKIGALSKGYRQRVGLAQAMIHDPKVLILDEPTSGLDPNQIVEIRDLITEVGREKTVLLSTHIMQEVEAICDRVMIIKNGRLVADDKTSELSKKGESKYSVLFEVDGMLLIENLKQIEGVLNVTQLEKNQWELVADRDIRKSLFDLAVEERKAILTMQQRDRSLEQVFRDLTM